MRDLLLASGDYLTGTGNVNWRVVAQQLDGVHYETLRKAIAGDRTPSMRLIEQVAQLVNVEPDYFAEYQLALAQRQFDVTEVGFDTAMGNLRRWSRRQAS